MKDIQEEISKLTSKFPFFGIYAKSVHDDWEIGNRQDEKFFTASTSKIITAISLYHKLEQDNKEDSSKVKFTEKDKAAGSGILQYTKPQTNSLYNFLVLMLTISDNTAADLIINFVTKRYQDKVINLLGLKKTHLRQTNREVVNGEYNLPADVSSKQWNEENKKRNGIFLPNAVSLDLDKANVSTPYEMYIALKELAEPQIISQNSANKIIYLMKRCCRNNLIPNLMPQTEIAHKTGGISTVINDIGIVYCQKPFYISMMTKGVEKKQEDRIKQVGEKITHLLIDKLGT